MNFDAIDKKGTTDVRRAFWSNVRDAVLSTRKIAGHNIKVSEYDGANTVIDLDRGPGGPTLGACCIGTGFFYGSCFDGYTQAECEDDPEVQGVWHGGEECDRDAVDCVFACCKDGDCTDETQQHCLDIGGEFQGLHVFCDDDPPPNCHTGACCDPITFDCTITTAALCDGVFAGEGTDCDHVDCTHIGACCTNGRCGIAPESSCGGIYQGDGTTCSELTGACCIEADCVENSDATCCPANGGTYQGDGTLCSPNPCDAGACCIGDVCSLLSDSDCNASGGHFFGHGTNCAGIVCQVCESTCGGCLGTVGGCLQLSWDTTTYSCYPGSSAADCSFYCCSIPEGHGHCYDCECFPCTCEDTGACYDGFFTCIVDEVTIDECFNTPGGVNWDCGASCP